MFYMGEYWDLSVYQVVSTDRWSVICLHGGILGPVCIYRWSLLTGGV